MSICPEKDIHSVYLDNELPPAYKGTYETHLATCSNCRERFLNMQHISNMLHKDADSIQLTDKELVESFARLQTKLKYSKVVHKTKFIDFQKNKWVLPAAAAVFACVFFLPFSKNFSNTVSVQSPISQPISIAASALHNDERTSFAMPVIWKDTLTSSSGIQKTVVPYANNDVSLLHENKFTTIDIFRPDFEENNHIMVKITLSNIGNMPTTTEFILPVRFISGVLDGNTK